MSAEIIEESTSPEEYSYELYGDAGDRYRVLLAGKSRGTANEAKIAVMTEARKILRAALEATTDAIGLALEDDGGEAADDPG